MKIAVLALLYLAAPALMVPDQRIETVNPKAVTVIYKSAENPMLNVSDDVPYIVDDGNCDVELVDFDSNGGNDLRRYTMLRAG